VHGFKIYIPEPPFAPVTPNIENQPNSIVGVSSKIIRTRYFESKEPGRRTMEHGTWNMERQKVDAFWLWVEKKYV